MFLTWMRLIGVSRGELSHDEYREIAATSIRAFSRTPPEESVLGGLLDELRYVSGSFAEPATYETLAAAAVRRADPQPRRGTSLTRDDWCTRRRDQTELLPRPGGMRLSVDGRANGRSSPRQWESTPR